MALRNTCVVELDALYHHGMNNDIAVVSYMVPNIAKETSFTVVGNRTHAALQSLVKATSHHP